MSARKSVIRETLALAVPIIFGQLGQMLMPLIDSAMVGRLGVVPLAAVAFGTMVVWVPMIAGFGLCVAVHVLAASAHGRNEPVEAGEVLRHGLWLATGYAAACGLAIQLGVNWLNELPRVDQEVINASKPFIIWMGWSTVPVLIFTVAKNYCESLNRPWLPLWVLCGCLVLNIFFNYVLIYGNLGAPAMGVAGAAAATTLARVAGVGALALCIWRTPDLRPEWRRGLLGWLEKDRVWRMLALGVPSAAQILFEVSLFNFSTLLAGMVSTVTLAAHQIALQVASMAFMVPLGISMATGIRISRAVGRGRFREAREIGWSSIRFAVAFMASYAVLVLVTRRWLPELFLKSTDAEAPAVMTLAATLLAWAASFAVFDGTQAATLGALRGMHDVRLPTGLLFTAYWVVSAPLAWYWGLHLGWGGPGIWAGLLTSLVVLAALLVGRFEILSRRQVKEEGAAAKME